MEIPGNNGWDSAGSAGTGVGSLAGRALAAVFGQVAEQAVHLGKVGPIDEVPALLLDADQACVRQLLQMERQGIARDAELVGQEAGRETAQASHDKRAEHAKPLGVGQGTKGENCLIFIHKLNHTTILESLNSR
ncbi:hypothetical protein G6F31_020954 [Rhizopus arrhizus]|nr:hypothetical protein G6F31_020954 [Rhizopus arrhizus]